MSKANTNNVEIWNSVQDGNREAFNQLYLQNIDSLYNYGLGICHDAQSVEDAIQDVFLSLWRKRKELTIHTSVKNYLFTSLRRQLLQNQKSTKFVTLETNEYISKRGIEDKKEITNHEDYLIEIKNKINQLPPREKEAIVLKYQEGWTYDEMSSIMSLKKHAIYKLVSRAVKKMTGKST